MQDIFNEIDSDAEGELDLDAALERYKKAGGKVYGEEDNNNKELQEDFKKQIAEAEPMVTSEPEPKSNVKTITDEAKVKLFEEKQKLKLVQSVMNDTEQVIFPGKIESLNLNILTKKSTKLGSLADIDTVDMSDWGSDSVVEKKAAINLPKLDPVGLAVAAQMIKTKKTRREFELSGWNRYMKGDEPGLPSWFVEDELEHMVPMNVNVDPEEVKFYAARDTALNARTLKKVMEARVRKQRRFKKTMGKIIKKTEAMAGSSHMSEFEKQQEIKNMYKKALKSREKKKVEYVVMSKKNSGKAPKGIKGKYKLVDPRLKKDVRAKMKLAKKKKTMGRGKK